MKHSIQNILFVALVALVLASSLVKAYEVCDSVGVRKFCTGNALTMTVSSGKGAHYLDVTKTRSQSEITDSMTVEMWLKPELQTGKKIYIAGIWGPNADKNDVWVIYITPQEELVFELNGVGTNLGENDNTFVKCSAASLFGKWNHLACVFDGRSQTASIYLNGSLVASARNSQYPLYTLRKLQDNDLLMQIGSSNSLSDNQEQNRTFKGQMDDIRLWKRVLTQQEIYCNMTKSLEGNEAGLVLFYRCNEASDIYILCDASGNDNWGLARSGASCQTSTREVPNTIIVSPNTTIYDTLRCDTAKTYTFTVLDTSVCGRSVYMRVWDYSWTEDKRFTINPRSTILQPQEPQTITVKFNGNFVGTIQRMFYVVRTNYCDFNTRINLNLTRITELSYSISSYDFKEVMANCENQPYVEKKIKICNNSKSIGTARSVTISNLITSLPARFAIVSDALPIVLPPDACTEITVRFYPGDSTAQYYDTLRVISDDKCSGSGLIPLMGKAQEVLGITNLDGDRLDTINFGTVCVNYVSDAVEYLWHNLLDDENIELDSIIVPNNFMSKSFKFAVIIEPNKGYDRNYFRFMPKSAGVFFDSIIFVAKAGSCQLRKKVYVRGKGFYADVRFNSTSISFGKVKVGQEAKLYATVQNYSDEVLNVSFYLRKGTAYFLTGTRSATLSPNQIVSVEITFRPEADSVYYDELCLYEKKCFTSHCIKLQGEGYIETFDFEPVVMRTENVVACDSALDTLKIINVSGIEQKLMNFSFDNPSGKYVMFAPSTLPGQLLLKNKEAAQFIFKYIPNDLTQDRADRAFLRYETESGEKWLAKLYGNSILPKIFVTEESEFGKCEVGDRRRDTLTIENISSIDILIDSISVGAGFELISPSSNIKQVLKPRESIQAIVDFVPAMDIKYSERINVYSSSPCQVSSNGSLSGEGIIVPLEVSLSVISYGFVRPCDCSIRSVPLVNQSLVFNRTIDSVWIDSASVANATPEYFSWWSHLSPQSKVPWDIPPLSFDTLYIQFCPKSPAQLAFLESAARIHIKASGTGWSASSYDTYLTGLRQMVQIPQPDLVSFPPTRVDTLSIPEYVSIAIPELSINPIRANVKIDSITFIPNERVFFASNSSGNSFPIVVDSSASKPILVQFKPRAVRDYTAKMAIYMSQPCIDLDTTVEITGRGFAPAFGLQFNFENNRKSQDTFRINYCDTLIVPVFSSREFPADIVDIRLRMVYDTTKLEFIGANSPYLLNSCQSYVPQISESSSTFGGSTFLLKNFCKIDSIQPFLISKFIYKNVARDLATIELDSISFDTEEVILYHIVAEYDDGIVVVNKPEFVVGNSISFGDSVQVLDCVLDTLLLINTGDTPLMLTPPDISQNDVSIIGSEPMFGAYYNPGDTANIFVQFCPRRKQQFDTTVSITNALPCLILDSTTITGKGFVPLLPMTIDISNDFLDIDTILVKLMDTASISLFFENNFSATIKNTEYWLKDLSFSVQMNYNPFALKYLDATSRLNGSMFVDCSPGKIIFNFAHIDSLHSGEFASVRFLATVPDTILTSIFLDASHFTTDSLYFVEIVPIGSQAKVITQGNCTISYLNEARAAAALQQNSPNPWTEHTSFDFSVNEDAYVTLNIFSTNGELVKELLDGKRLLKAGSYSVDMSSQGMQSGTYFYVIQIGSFTQVKAMSLVK